MLRRGNAVKHYLSFIMLHLFIFNVLNSNTCYIATSDMTSLHFNLP